ncbi:PTS system beta-glucosides-specific IIC component [Paenibacillus turicensis]|uniref:PTS system beta-glucosides-specific IIC component n=1 Tax=Paenibacillus turicensis TaxID=160487 RepID=A0ABS4FWT3_9BACL|nr:beta-glucoside-specific PTS transporter subunit IIABC [Paenibacillus turicensis]MBP1907035.1 PTS system beta-glucosides-specific IIC component [Paenibacillus turicensis]
MDYKLTASEVLKHVGGKDNISQLEHCSTRLRFSLHDYSKVDVDHLQRVPGVIAVKMIGQCQVVIGNDVVEVYDEIIELLGGMGHLSGAGASTSTSSSTSSKKNIGSVLLDFITSIFSPLIPAIAGGGILKSVLLLLGLMKWMDPSGQTYQLLFQIGDAPLYYIPLLVAVTTAKKLKVNQLVALSAVGALMLPKVTAMITEGAMLFGFPIKNISYAYQVFPAILTILLYAQLEKLFTRISPKAIRIFFVPMMSLVITVPISLLLLGPLGYTLGEGFSSVIVMLFSKVGWVATALLAAVLPFMVSVGMHKALLPYAITSVTTTGKELLYLPASLAHNIAESGACFAVAIRTRDKELRSTAISAGISALFGITEPALYGVTLQNKKVLGSVMIGSLIGGAFIGIVGVEVYVLVGPGLASMSMFVSESLPQNIINAFIGLIISFVAPFIILLIFGKDRKDKNQNQQMATNTVQQKTQKSQEVQEIKSPVIGQQILIADVNDEVFSSKAMGEGVAIIPSKGELYAPVDGQIAVVYNRSHAIAMKMENGCELLFHVGIDTVRLQGKYFEPVVKAGDMVKAGDLLLKFEIDKIIEAGYDPVTIMVVSSKDDYDAQVEPLHLSKREVGNTDTVMTITTKGGE